MAIKKIELCCKFTNVNFACLPELPARLGKFGFEVVAFSASINSYPTIIDFDSIDDLPDYIKTNGQPNSYRFSYDSSGTPRKNFTIDKLINIHKEKLLLLEATGFGNEEMLKDIASFLGVEPDYYKEEASKLEKSVFIAHRFDKQGTELAEKLARFLALLGFAVKTGRAFSPKSVALKVKERLKSQSIILVIYSKGDDSTWLTQESIIESSEKPLFILKENGVEFKPGILADLEFIPFNIDAIEETFIPILEGLKEIKVIG